MGLAPAGFHERLLPAIFCSPKKRDAKRCSLASCNRSICTSLYVKGSPTRAYLRRQSRLPGSVRATSCGAHLDWPSRANRPLQSQLTAARVKGTGPDGSLGFAQLARYRRSRRAVQVSPSSRPSIADPAGSGPQGQARDGLRWPREWTRRPTPGRAEKRRISGMIGAAFFRPFLLLLTKRDSPPREGGETRRTPAMPITLAEREKGKNHPAPLSFRAQWNGDPESTPRHRIPAFAGMTE